MNVLICIYFKFIHCLEFKYLNKRHLIPDVSFGSLPDALSTTLFYSRWRNETHKNHKGKILSGILDSKFRHNLTFVLFFSVKKKEEQKVMYNIMAYRKH